MSITIKYNENEEMMEITKDGVVIFDGNYWDFAGDPRSVFNLLTDDLGFDDVYLSDDLPDYEERYEINE